MTTADVLAAMDEEKAQIQERQATGTFKFVFLTMSVGPKKNGQPATIGQKVSFRALYKLDQAILMVVHHKYNKPTNSYTDAVCAVEIGKPCDMCEQAKNDKKLSPVKSLMLPVWMHAIKNQFDKDGPWFPLTSKNEDGEEKAINGMRILELQNSGAIEPVFRTIRRVHSGDAEENIPPRDIRTLDFVMECRGVGTDKKLTLDRRDPTSIPDWMKDAIPSREEVKALILDARPPRIVGGTPAASPVVSGSATNGHSDGIPEF
jgi:hypothetical protein